MTTIVVLFIAIGLLVLEKHRREDNALHMHQLYKTVFLVAMTSKNESGAIPATIEEVFHSQHGNFDWVDQQLIRTRMGWYAKDSDYLHVLYRRGYMPSSDELEVLLIELKTQSSLAERRLMITEALEEKAWRVRSNLFSENATNVNALDAANLIVFR